MQDDEIFTAAEKEKLFGLHEGPVHPSTQAFINILDELKDLSFRKGKDYGTDADPDINLKNGRVFGLPNWVTIACRMDDKLSRIKTAAYQRIRDGQVQMQNESLEDAFKDLAVYAIKALVRIKEEGI